MSGRFTRISVLGSRRNADIVIPSDVPIDMVMTQIVQTLGEDPRRAYVLATTAGTSLTASRSLRELSVEDGVILQIAAADLAPPSPTVFDISESAERVLDEQPSRWTAATRRTGLSILAALSILLASFAIWARLDGEAKSWLYLGVAAAFIVLGSALFHFRLREAGRVFAVTGGILGALILPLGSLLAPTLPAAWLIAVMVPMIATASASDRPIPWLFGIATLGVVIGLNYLVDSLTASPLRTAAIMGTICLLLVGLMPQGALALSGVFAAQRRTDQIARTTADLLVARAHGILTTTVCVLAIAAALTVWTLILDPGANIWSWALAGALGLGASLRQRAFPLAPEKLSLWLVGLSALLAATFRLFLTSEGLGYVGIAVLGALAVGFLIVAHASIPEHTQAQLRQMGNHIETLALVAAVPLVVGLFGVYADLLRILD